MSMNPVALICLPNIPYLLGTFDTAKFQTWWRSNPFPDELETIKKGFHIYGRTHLAIAKRKDGLWALYRSKNYGIDWDLAFLAAPDEVIYDLVLITYGWAIMNTSRGFYETVDAGANWSQFLELPDAPNAPAFYNIGGGDTLLCADGRYIWRSTDIARSWLLVCDSHTIRFSDGGDWGRTPPKDERYHTYYKDLSIPCIAGANGRVFASAGPFLIISEDSGQTWEGFRWWPGYCTYWDSYTKANIPPPKTLVYDRLWPSPSPPKFLISQILVTSVDGPTGDDVVFMVRCDDRVPISGESNLYSRFFKTHKASIHQDNVYNGYYFGYVFQQYLSDASCQQMASYDLLVTGQPYSDRLVFSAQTRMDASGNLVPSLKYSLDGGQTWIDIDVSRIQVGNASEGGLASGSMLDDRYARLTWIAGGCCNDGKWDIKEFYRRQCLSYEMDAGITKKATRDQNIDAIVALDKSSSENIDAIVANPKKRAPYDVDAMAEGLVSKSYRIDRTLEGKVTKEQDVDAILSIDHVATDNVDAHIWALLKKYYKLDVLFKSRLSKLYNIDAIVVTDELNQTVQEMIAKFPQFMDLVDPGLPYEVYDSRRERL